MEHHIRAIVQGLVCIPKETKSRFYGISGCTGLDPAYRSGKRVSLYPTVGEYGSFFVLLVLLIFGMLCDR